MARNIVCLNAQPCDRGGDPMLAPLCGCEEQSSHRVSGIVAALPLALSLDSGAWLVQPACQEHRAHPGRRDLV